LPAPSPAYLFSHASADDSLSPILNFSEFFRGPTTRDHMSFSKTQWSQFGVVRLSQRWSKFRLSCSTSPPTSQGREHREMPINALSSSSFGSLFLLGFPLRILFVPVVKSLLLVPYSVPPKFIEQSFCLSPSISPSPGRVSRRRYSLSSCSCALEGSAIGVETGWQGLPPSHF